MIHDTAWIPYWEHDDKADLDWGKPPKTPEERREALRKVEANEELPGRLPRRPTAPDLLANS